MGNTQTESSLSDSSKQKKGKAKKSKFWQEVEPPTPTQEEKCAVCLFELKATEDEEQLTVVQLLKCSHYFHEACIRNCVDKDHLKCPVSNTPITRIYCKDMWHTLWNFDWKSTTWFHACFKLFPAFTWI